MSKVKKYLLLALLMGILCIPTFLYFVVNMYGWLFFDWQLDPVKMYAAIVLGFISGVICLFGYNLVEENL